MLKNCQWGKKQKTKKTFNVKFASQVNVSCCQDICTGKWQNTDYKNCSVAPYSNACVRWLIPFSTKMVLVLRDVAQNCTTFYFRAKWCNSGYYIPKSFFRQIFGISHSNPFYRGKKHTLNPMFLKCISVHWISNHCYFCHWPFCACNIFTYDSAVLDTVYAWMCKTCLVTLALWWDVKTWTEVKSSIFHRVFPHCQLFFIVL